MWRRYCCLRSFFPIVDTCLSCEEIARRSCGMMVPGWRLFGDILRAVPIQHKVTWAEAYLHTKSDLDAPSRLDTIKIGRKLGVYPFWARGAGSTYSSVAWTKAHSSLI